MDFWGKEDIATDARMDGQLKKTSFVALLYPKIIPRNAGRQNSWHRKICGAVKQQTLIKLQHKMNEFACICLPI